MANIGIIGAGSWGTALAWLLSNNGSRVTVWSVIEEEIQMLKEGREQKDKLPGVILPADMEFTTDLASAVDGKDMLVLAVPSPYTRSTAAKMAPYVKSGQKIINVAKGIEESTLMTLSEIIEEEIPQAETAVLSGPSHAEEVGKGIPTTIVVGAKNRQTAEFLQNLFMSPVFRVYISSDVMGIEIGAALKNVVALAAGMADGLGYGDNTKAALRDCGDRKAWHQYGRQDRDFLRSHRYRGSDRHLCVYAFQKPPCGYFDRKGRIHGRSHERSEDGGRGRVFRQSRLCSFTKIWCQYAYCGAGQPDFV